MYTGVLDIFDFGERTLDAHVQDLISEREEARRREDWRRADDIRERLRAMGVEVQDKKLDDVPSPKGSPQ